jgi:hypothetical protein
MATSANINLVWTIILGKKALAYMNGSMVGFVTGATSTILSQTIEQHVLDNYTGKQQS